MPVSTHEQIIRTATALFAQRGFRGVSTRDIAAGAGVNLAAIHYHIGSKRQLYITVLRRLCEREREVIDRFVGAAIAEVDSDPLRSRELAVESVIALIDLTHEYPSAARLYINRWLDELGELRGEDVELTLPLFASLRDALVVGQRAGVVSPDLDPRMFLRSFSWLIYGYFVSGPLDWEMLHGDPHDADNLEDFKAFVRRYMHLMLSGGQPPQTPEDPGSRRHTRLEPS